MTKKIENLVKFFVILTFIAPWLAFVESYIFPFVVPKILFFRILVLLLSACYVLLLSMDWQKYRPKFTILNATVLLFYISLVLSTLVGVDWYRSFWDNHERMLGVFTLTHYIVYYFILTSVFRDWNDWRNFLRLFLGAGAVVMIIGVFQRFGNEQILMNQGERVYGTLGNPIYFSGYGLFLFFIGYLLAIKEKGQQKVLQLSGVRAFWFWYATFGSLLGFWGVFGGNTRGAFLGLIVGIGVLLFSYVFNLRYYKKAKQTIYGIIILGLVLLSTLFFFRKTDFVSQLPAIGRLLNTEISSSDTRMMAWSVALDAWKEKPLLGWGPNNYYYAFNKYYKPEFLEHGWGETWFDNAHSVVVNTLATQGLLGLIIYLSIFFVAILTIWRNRKSANVDIHLVSVSSAFLIAHLVSIMTVFENPTSYLYFFFFLAMVGSMGMPEIGNSDFKKRADVKSPPIIVFIIVGIVTFLIIFSTNINSAKANKTTLKAIRALNGGNVSGAVALYEEAQKYPSPHIDDIRNDFTRLAAQNLMTMYQQGNKEQAEKLYDLCVTELKKNLELHPLDIRIHIQLAQVSQIGFNLRNDVSYLIYSEFLLEQARELSPKRQQVAYTLSNFKFMLNKTDEGILLLEETLRDDEKIAESWWRLASAYAQYGFMDKAQLLLVEAKEKNINFTGKGKEIVDSIESSTQQ